MRGRVTCLAIALSTQPDRRRSSRTAANDDDVRRFERAGRGGCAGSFLEVRPQDRSRYGPDSIYALHRLEVPNAFELLVGRQAITRDESRSIQKQLQDDLQNQRLAAVSMDLDRFFADAIELSRLHTAKFLARSLDLLHVSATHVIACTTFVSADDRQLAVANANGLKTIDVKRRLRRT